MTVKELIEHLQTCNPDLPVAICTDDFYGYYTVRHVKKMMFSQIAWKTSPTTSLMQWLSRVY